METIQYEGVKETVYFEQMTNGLRVYILPKQGYHKTYCTFTTQYGSIDNTFVPFGENDFVRVPDGIAHFLEHKLFEKEDGDVFQKFSKQGASANAFTSFTRTAYLFSATSNVNKNLQTLLDFVQEPWFSDASVEKEKGIIGQEIQMYQDNPDWRLYFGLIGAMFAHHPVKIDIAGTEKSIDAITKELLYQCYHTFYHPSNMLLFIVGDVQPTEMMDFVRDNQNKKDFKDRPPVVHKNFEETREAYEKKIVIPMSVQTSKCLVGIKTDSPHRSGTELLKHELSISILLDYLFGYSSKNYKELYDDGIIDDSFSFDYSEENGYGFAMIGGDCENPDELAKRIKNVLLRFKENPLTEDVFERLKRKKIGGFLRALNSPEFIANQFTRYEFNEMNLFDVTTTLHHLQLEEVIQNGIDFIDETRMSICQVVPK